MRKMSNSVALAMLMLCAFAMANTSNDTSTSNIAPNSTDHNNNNNYSTNNFNCPEDCDCIIAHNTHKPFLHAKCSSLDGLKSEAPLQATLPIHSIDLSYLGLERLSHSLEKLRDLTSIDLSHNELHEIGHLGRRIKKLNLRHNHITSGKLTKMPQHVQILNLQHNDITYLPLEFTKLAHLQTLELSHNQINCSCETLEVRNWLQQHNVFMEYPVVCSHPAEVKGKPWLQVRQSDICDKEKKGIYTSVDENELMLGDQPAIEGSGENDEDEELGRAFMPIERKLTRAVTEAADTSELVPFDDVEGSGDVSEMSMRLLTPTAAAEQSDVLLMHASDNGVASTTTEMAAIDEDEEGSGSGGGMLIIPNMARSFFDTFDEEVTSEHPVDAPASMEPIVEESQPQSTPSAAIFGAGMGIFDTEEKTELPTSTEGAPVQEEAIVPIVHHSLETENVPSEDTGINGASSDETAAGIATANVAEKSEFTATFYLLAVIVLIVVGLILFVAIKRCKNKHNAAHDPENPRQTELLDMDKKHLGKPLQRNGIPEHAPLIGDKSKSDMARPINGTSPKKPYDAKDVKDGPTTQQQPLLNGNGTATANGNAPAAPTVGSPDEIIRKDAPTNNMEAAPAPAPSPTPQQHEYYPITPRYPTPKSPRASKYAQHPASPVEPNNNAEEPYLPSSPKSARYSPVYSPETGRVKIKLSETPKPKTPMLVTRSKSNAGDIITTPVHHADQVATVAATVPVHVAPADGGGGANGYISK